MGFERDTKTLPPPPHKLYLVHLYMLIFGALPEPPFFCTICVPTHFFKKLYLWQNIFLIINVSLTLVGNWTQIKPRIPGRPITIFTASLHFIIHHNNARCKIPPPQLFFVGGLFMYVRCLPNDTKEISHRVLYILVACMWSGVC